MNLLVFSREKDGQGTEPSIYLLEIKMLVKTAKYKWQGNLQWLYVSKWRDYALDLQQCQKRKKKKNQTENKN